MTKKKTIKPKAGEPKNVKLMPIKPLAKDKEELRAAVNEIIECAEDVTFDGYVVYAWCKGDPETGWIDTGNVKYGSLNPYLVPNIVAEALRKWV